MQASQNPTPSPWRFAGKVIEVRVDQDVTAEAVHKAVDRVLHLVGCPGCGLLGFDLSFLGDPSLKAEFASIQGIQSAQIVER